MNRTEQIRALAILGTASSPLCEAELYLLGQRKAVINGHPITILFGTDAVKSLSTPRDRWGYGLATF